MCRRIPSRQRFFEYGSRCAFSHRQYSFRHRSAGDRRDHRQTGGFDEPALHPDLCHDDPYGFCDPSFFHQQQDRDLPGLCAHLHDPVRVSAGHDRTLLRISESGVPDHVWSGQRLRFGQLRGHFRIYRRTHRGAGYPHSSLYQHHRDDPVRYPGLHLQKAGKCCFFRLRR